MIELKPNWFSKSDRVKLDKLVESFEYPELLRTRSDYQALLEGCYYNKNKGEKPEQFCSQIIRQVVGRFNNKPLELLPWQTIITRSMYGWMRPDGFRRFRSAYISVGKKNGKSTILSALSLYSLICDGESNPQCFIAANDRSQAGIIFNHASNFVKNSPELKKVLKVLPSTKRIIYDKKYGFIQALSKDTTTADGLDSSFTVIDELHTAPNAEMYNTLRFAGSARQQPLFIVITTAGDNLDSICGREYSLAKKLLNSEIIDVSCFAAIHEASIDDDISNPDTWRKANPSIGVMISLDDIERDYKVACETNNISNFRRRRLNQWVKTDEYFISRDQWDACFDEDFPDPDILAEYDCYLGLDLADTTDITAVTAVFVNPEDTEKIYVVPFFFVPEDTVLKRVQGSSLPYDHWVSSGLLTATDGACADFEAIYEFILDLSKRWNIKCLAYDPWQSASLVSRFETEGIVCIKVPQNLSNLSTPTKLFQTMVLNKSIRHAGNGVMNWMVTNAIIVSDHNMNIRLSKSKSREKIDGAASLVTALTEVQHALHGEGELYRGEYGIGFAVI